jgi:hypothetical protein
MKNSDVGLEVSPEKKIPIEGGPGPAGGIDVMKRNSVEEHEIVKVVKRGSRAGSRKSLTKSRLSDDGNVRLGDRCVDVVSELGGSVLGEDTNGGIDVDQNQINL